LTAGGTVGAEANRPLLGEESTWVAWVALPATSTTSSATTGDTSCDMAIQRASRLRVAQGRPRPPCPAIRQAAADLKNQDLHIMLIIDQALPASFCFCQTAES
jgi:hypothetical protein